MNDNDTPGPPPVKILELICPECGTRQIEEDRGPTMYPTCACCGKCRLTRDLSS